MVQRPPAGTIPDAPGSYQFKDADGRVIYVGKAKSLRSRLSNYFVNPASLPPRTAQMVAAAESVEWIQVRNDVEALMLEYSLIKQHRPRFNIRLRDDKSYPFLAITVGDEWPRAMVMRGKKRKGTRYFGPYGHAYAIRETLDLLLRTFPIRTCSDNKFDHHQRLGRPVPAVPHREVQRARAWARSTRREYDRLVDELIEFLDGETQPVVRRLERQMREAADDLEFERAARLPRPAGQRAQGHREAADGHRAARGPRRDRHRRRRARGGRPGVLRAPGPGGGPQGLRRRQGGGRHARRSSSATCSRASTPRPTPPASPTRCWCPTMPDDPDLYRRVAVRGRGGRTCRIRVPQRGDKRALQATVTQNAKEEFVRHRLRRASDHNARARALNALQDALDLPDAPLRIECFDMSHIQGSDYVGSMVVMEDGLPKKSDYRRFKIRDGRRQRRLRGHGGGAHPPAHRPARRAGAVRWATASGPGSSPTRPTCCWSTAARASSAWPSGWSRTSAWRTRSRWPPWPSGSRRSSCPARPTPSASPASPRRSTCCSGCGTRPTASPSPTTASCGASA